MTIQPLSPSRPVRPAAWAAVLVPVAVWASGCALPPTAATVAREVSMAKASCQPTVYPEEAKRLGAAGQTEVEMEVNPAGKVTRVAIIRSSGSTAGHQALDALAINTISKCSFPPAPGFLSGTGRMVYLWRLEG